MNTIDDVYRFGPRDPGTTPSPADADQARRALEDGNRPFARRMEGCRTGAATPGDEPAHVVRRDAPDVGMIDASGEVGGADGRLPRPAARAGGLGHAP